MTDKNTSAGPAWTTGPWSWHEDIEDIEVGGMGCWTLAPGVLLADGTDGTPGGDEIDRANAHLIAAAPDLYEALEEIRRIGADIPLLEKNPRFTAANQAALRALAKARGQ